ncbi:hypothetical protein I5Q34_17135 [Streptomyces sp. AV19]|uniref:DUF5691 domain-containing protein n=1 Tax=Streptomyces sp. AV19 TaxID=2793068 RepID=UPI0018FEA898|nr:DUF5691 domain-containing protein [Streptomyces sp. AV19]MBH1935971.1 hypothetical protein [Streptomyces sp. AV19]MDG4534237.1 DUF5691 domain-containing protein [Streptomyces sp. AV19]
MNAEIPWDDLVTTALLGTGRRAAPVRCRPGQDPALALLDAAAVHTVRRRAAALPVGARARPGPAPADPRPPLPAAARRRLAGMLDDRSGSAGGRRAAGPDLVELLPQWLAAANGHGYRAPDELLPGLLDAARARTGLRPGALALAGPRGLWLARLNPQWAYALRAPSAGGPAPGDEGRVWREGLFAERSAVLAAMRGYDPGAARELLAGTWAKERAEDRAAFLGALREGLSPADEPFLERALDDRARDVRALAAELLARLPGSALAARMTERARGCVAPEGRLITVEAPHECDAAMRRDGISAAPPSGRGRRSWWLGRIVEATPLAFWPVRLGVAGAAEAVALPVADGRRADLHAAWCRAAIRSRDAEWARALLGPATAPPAPDGSPGRDPARLLSVLPEPERAAWAGRFVAAHGLSDAFRLLAVCEAPWARPLGRAVVDALGAAREAGGYPWSFSGVMGLAERCVDPAEAGRLRAGRAGGADHWAEAFGRLEGTLRLRAAMREELGG